MSKFVLFMFIDFFLTCIYAIEVYETGQVENTLEEPYDFEEKKTMYNYKSRVEM